MDSTSTACRRLAPCIALASALLRIEPVDPAEEP